MTSALAAGFGSYAQVTGIYELNVLVGFLQPFGVCAFGKIGTIFEAGVARLDVGFFFGGFIFG